ncbi:hypothetical protein KP509_15G063000 [Ceratopteris richardii]|uniref:Homeobox protein knotted-1-like 3 n=2 Tax=Ceratopteris richardii TaxID=49495 RepID=A0A8T2T7V4_CERRI|nr:hypothetical protein KP509_15G063000 [Ceratopteris richardii]
MDRGGELASSTHTVQHGDAPENTVGLNTVGCRLYETVQRTSLLGESSQEDGDGCGAFSATSAIDSIPVPTRHCNLSKDDLNPSESKKLKSCEHSSSASKALPDSLDLAASRALAAHGRCILSGGRSWNPHESMFQSLNDGTYDPYEAGSIPSDIDIQSKDPTGLALMPNYPSRLVLNNDTEPGNIQWGESQNIRNLNNRFDPNKARQLLHPGNHSCGASLTYTLNHETSKPHQHALGLNSAYLSQTEDGTAQRTNRSATWMPVIRPRKSNEGIDTSLLQACLVAHPLFEHLLAAHVACVSICNTWDTSQTHCEANRERQFAGVKKELETKYLLLAQNIPPPSDKEDLDHFMLSFTLLLQTFREQLREHMTTQAFEALAAYGEIREAFQKLTGDVNVISADPSQCFSTMSDDEGWQEDDIEMEDVTQFPCACENRSLHDEDMDMMMCDSQSNNVLNEIDRTLMERIRKELKSELKQNYKSTITDVREEIMRKRKAGKLPASTTFQLRKWWDSHSKWPYPSEEEKQRLAHETGLELKQINNWFINQRKRNWTSNPALEGADQMGDLCSNFSLGQGRPHR